jgi:hypothetical protein
MSVISIRLNKEEEEMLKTLSSYYEEEKSTLIKHSLRELYEDLIDRKEIDRFEKMEAEGSISFISSDDLLRELED